MSKRLALAVGQGKDMYGCEIRQVIPSTRTVIRSLCCTRKKAAKLFTDEGLESFSDFGTDTTKVVRLEVRLFSSWQPV